MMSGRVAREQRLKERVKDLEQEKAELQRKLERAQMWESSFAGGVREKMDEQIDRLQIERDEAVRNANFLQAEHGLAIRQAQERLESSRQDIGQKQKMLIDAIENKGYVNGVTRALAMISHQMIAQTHDRLRDGQLNVVATDHHDALPFTRHSVQMLEQQLTATVTMELASDATQMAYNLQHDPLLICSEVEHIVMSGDDYKLDDLAESLLKPLSQLEPDWIKKHISSNRSASPKLLSEALCHGWRSQGHTAIHYAQQQYLPLENVNLYRRYWRTLRKQAKRADPHIVKLMKAYQGSKL